MKKTGLILSIYFFVAAAYSALFILLVPVKNVLFFSGLIVAGALHSLRRSRLQ